MQPNEFLNLGLGLTPPWKLIDQRLDMDKSPHELHLRIEADPGSLYPCPDCNAQCKGHDFKELTWRQLNFFQHHCYFTAPVPRIKPGHLLHFFRDMNSMRLQKTIIWVRNSVLSLAGLSSWSCSSPNLPDGKVCGILS